MFSIGMKTCRILLVDDEPQVRSFVKAFLVASRFEVVEANDGIEALEVIKAANGMLDLLIADIKMPRMDGISLARCVGRTYSHLPVLFISGYSSGPDPIECAEVPRWDFLAKPFLPKALLQKVSELLGADAKSSAGV